jgi:hypothetical protein
VSRILKTDLKAKPYKRVTVHKLNDKNKQQRLERARWLLRRFPNEDRVKNVVFTDESVFPMSGYHNRQNERIYAVAKEIISDVELINERQQFPRSLMVWVGVSTQGKLPLIFCEEGCKLNAERYRDDILRKVIPYANKMHNGKWVLQQDSAPSHRAESTQSYIKENVPSHIPAKRWPPCSPDLNPLDYSIWGILKSKVYATHYTTIEEFKTAIVSEFNNLSQAHINNAISIWRKRLNLVIRAEGGHIEHK